MARTRRQAEHLRRHPPSANLVSLLCFVRDYTAEHGRPPSLLDIGAEFRVKRQRAAAWVETLRRKGLLVKQPYRPRSLRVVGPIPKPAANGHRE